jgi:hypothetical protein
MTDPSAEVLAGLDRCILSALACGHTDNAAILESIRTRIAALVEAARVFDRLPHESIPNNVTIDFVCRAGQWRALSTALRAIGH